MKPIDLSKIRPSQLGLMSDDNFQAFFSQVMTLREEDRKLNALYYYESSQPKALEIHKANERVLGVFGGNGSSKTETALAHLFMFGLGICPLSMRNEDGKIPAWWMDKFRGPVNCRVVVESLTTTLHNIILAKLKWWKWTGISSPGGEKGHWGWVPKDALLKGSWETSWSEKLRTLTVKCHDPDDASKELGESTYQFMSHDQDPADFASGELHWCMFDEPPRLPIWVECQARTMRGRGRTILAMTWSDDPAIPQDWIDEEIYDRGMPGPNKHPEYGVYTLFTTDNPHQDQESIAMQAGLWNEETKLVRLYGGRLRMSSRVHKLFTDSPMTWCFGCNDTCVAVCDPEEMRGTEVGELNRNSPWRMDGSRCGKCNSTDIVDFCHVDEDADPGPNAPAVWLLDPHPRKPHMFCWAQITAADDIYIRAEGTVDGDAVQVREYVDEKEAALSLNVTCRLMDPNMGASPTARREISWQDEFDLAGLRCDLADRSEVGRMRIDDFLKPDPHTRLPRILVHPDCTGFISQMRKFAWDNYRSSLDRDVKQTPKPKNDDYPALMRYLMNMDPQFEFLLSGPRVFRPREKLRQNRDSRLDDRRYFQKMPHQGRVGWARR